MALRGPAGVLQAIHNSKDPTSLSVLLEDSAALTGVLLCAVAGLMVYESKGLLVGEGVDRQTLAQLRALVKSDPTVEHVRHLHTIYQSPHEVLWDRKERDCTRARWG